MARSVNFSIDARSRSIHSIEENEILIRKFAKMTKKSGLIEKVKNNRFYEKPSVARRRKKKNKLKKSRDLTAKKHIY